MWRSAFTILPLAVPGCVGTPETVTNAEYASNVSMLISPSNVPSSVNATSAPNASSGKATCPRPISSSGVKPILIVGRGTSGCAFRYSTAAMITAMPALSSAPSSVVPSDVMIVSPLHFRSSGLSFGSMTTPAPRASGRPSYFSWNVGFTSLPDAAGDVSRCAMRPTLCGPVPGTVAVT